MSNPRNSPSTEVAHGDLVRFCFEHVLPSPGDQVDWEIAYEWYSDWHGHEGRGEMEPLSARGFVDAFWHVCQAAGIRVRKSRRRVYCLGVRLIDPGVKALPAPG